MANHNKKNSQPTRKAPVAKAGKRAVAPAFTASKAVNQADAWVSSILAGYARGWAEEIAARKAAMTPKPHGWWLISEAASAASKLTQAAFGRMVAAATFGRFHKPKVEKTWVNRGGRKANPKSGLNAPKGGAKAKTEAQLRAEARLKAFKAARHQSVLGQGLKALVGVFSAVAGSISKWILIPRAEARTLALVGPGAAHESEVLGAPDQIAADRAAESQEVVSSETGKVAVMQQTTNSTVGIARRLRAMGFEVETSKGSLTISEAGITLPERAVVPSMNYMLVEGLAKWFSLDFKHLLSKNALETEQINATELDAILRSMCSPFETRPESIRTALGLGFKFWMVDVNNRQLEGLAEFKPISQLGSPREDVILLATREHKKLVEKGWYVLTYNQLAGELIKENGALLEKPQDLLSLFKSNLSPKMVDDKAVITYALRNQRYEVTFEVKEDPENLAEGLCWFVNGKLINRYQVMNGDIVDARCVVYALAKQLANTTSHKTAKGILEVKAVSCFREEFYDYAHMDRAIKAVCTDKVGMLAVSSHNSWDKPSVTDTGSVMEFANAAHRFLRSGIPATVDSQVGSLYVARAARLKYLALRGDVVVNANDSSKISKFFNRGQLNVQRQAKILEGLVEDKLEVVKGIRREGVKLNVMLSNLIINPGEGVSWIRPDVIKTLDLKKTIVIELPNMGKATSNFREELIENLAIGANKTPFKQASVASDAVLLPGRTAVWYKDKPLKAMAQDEIMMKRTVVSINLEVDSENNNARLTLITQVNWVDQMLKLRGANIKTTTMPGIVEFESGLEMPELLIGNSGMKIDGNMLPVISMWANTDTDGVYYDLEKGLTDEQSQALNEFVATNGFSDWVTVRDIHEEVWYSLKGAYENDARFKFPELGVVSQLCDIIQGEMVLSVEVSTVRENIGTQGMTGEYISTLVTVLPEIRNKILNNMDTSAAGALCMAQGTETDYFYFTEERKFFKHCGDSLEEIIVEEMASFEELHKLNRDVYRATMMWMEQKFPGGLTVIYNKPVDEALPEADRKRINIACTLNFKALTRWESARSLCGEAAYKLIHLLLDRQVEAVQLYRQINMVKKAAVGMIDSGAVIKSLTRTVNTTQVTGKIKPIVTNLVDVWEIGIHPAHARVIGLNTGDWVALSRSPMVSPVFLEVKVDERMPVGVFTVHGPTWAAANEGDGDGDGCAVLNLKLFGVEMTFARAMELNKRIVSCGGYRALYGDPMAKYVSEYMNSDDLVKKSPVATRKGETLIDIAEYTDAIEKVGSHYRMFVGITFAMASALTFMYEANAQRKANVHDLQAAIKLGLESGLAEDSEEIMILVDEMTNQQSKIRGSELDMALNVAWRALYEGQALSGYSVTAGKLAKAIARLAKSPNGFYGVDREDFEAGNTAEIQEQLQSLNSMLATIKDTPYAKLIKNYSRDWSDAKDGSGLHFSVSVTSQADDVSTFEDVLDVAQINMGIALAQAGIVVPVKVARLLAEINILRSLYGALERSQTSGYHGSIDKFIDTLAPRAAVYGLLRRTGGGMVHNAMLDLDESNSLANIVTDESLVDELALSSGSDGLNSSLGAHLMSLALPILQEVDELRRKKNSADNEFFAGLQ